MKKQEYSLLEDWYAGFMAGFAEAGALPPPLVLKELHSRNVAADAALIAAGEGAGEDGVTLARAAGLLHDAGRFTQFRKFRSFRDADTLDHGAEGFNVLAVRLPGVLKNTVERESLLTAVRYHNRRNADIPVDLPAGGQGLLRIVRDADKLDIFRIVLDSAEADGFKDLPVMLPHIRCGMDLTPEVAACVLGGQPPLFGSLRTVGDYLLMTAVWFGDLNNACSRSLAATRGYPARLRRQLPPGAALDALFADIEKALPH